MERNQGLEQVISVLRIQPASVLQDTELPTMFLTYLIKQGSTVDETRVQKAPFLHSQIQRGKENVQSPMGNVLLGENQKGTLNKF